MLQYLLVKLRNGQDWSKLTNWKTPTPSQRINSANVLTVVFSPPALVRLSTQRPAVRKQGSTQPRFTSPAPDISIILTGKPPLPLPAPLGNHCLGNVFTLMTRETAVICHYRNIQLSSHRVMSAASHQHLLSGQAQLAHLSEPGPASLSQRRA